jgi:hypothetical protein
MAITSVSKDFIVKHGLVVNTTATILGNTESVSTSTGALIVSGGVGIAKTLNAANVFVANSGTFGIYGTTSSYVGFVAPNSLSTNTVYTLPSGDGSNGQVLITDGNKTLSWADQTGVGGGEETFPTGDYMNVFGATETHVGSGGEDPTDAFGVSLTYIYDCMDPEGKILTKDLGAF